MNMTRTLVVLLVAGAFAVPAQAGVNARQDRQDTRIANGWQAGQLGRGEAFHLLRQQHRIDRAETRMRADGRLDGRERLRLDVRQDRASRHIFVTRHNGRGR